MSKKLSKRCLYGEPCDYLKTITDRNNARGLCLDTPVNLSTGEPYKETWLVYKSKEFLLCRHCPFCGVKYPLKPDAEESQAQPTKNAVTPAPRYDDVFIEGTNELDKL